MTTVILLKANPSIPIVFENTYLSVDREAKEIWISSMEDDEIEAVYDFDHIQEASVRP